MAKEKKQELPLRRIEYVPVQDLVAAARNPKRHAEAELDVSVGRFGYTEPVLLDERTGRLIAGHGRISALLRLKKKGQQPPDGVVEQAGSWLVPVVRGWSSRSDQEADAYLLASNQLTAAGGWDNMELSQMLKELDAAAALDGVGFSETELQKLLNYMAPPEEEDAGGDGIPQIPGEPWVQQGDLFELGPHLLLCGDCRHPPDVERALNGMRINVAVTSPPYAAQREYDKQSGFKPVAPEDYVAWFRPVAENMRGHMAEGASYFLNIKESVEDGQRLLYVKDLTLAHAREWGWRFREEFAWTHGGSPGRVWFNFKNQWEPVFQFSLEEKIKIFPKAVAKASNSVPKGGGGNTSALQGAGEGWTWDEASPGMAFPGNVLDLGRNRESFGHDAAFPVALPEWLLKAYSEEGDVVFDPFMGSGTTLIAAERTKRVAVGVEISARYVQVILERWEKLTGRKATKVS